MPKKVHVEDKGKRLRSTTRRRTPKGHFVVYADVDGGELRRFVVPLGFLEDPLFRLLLDDAASEYGFHAGSKIILPLDRFREFVSLR
ncbi:hypothetical protein MLD38_034603 [Melastoma candidum]|nr:hypothetical protein MLD38_034603 [Melastoma candidum]